jgi:hypothetical protein
VNLYCCACSKDIAARLTNGAETYPHRADLHSLPFWKCDTCANFVGCHHKTDNPTKPLGCISDKEIKNARKHIHALIDPVWKSGAIGRRKLYKRISAAMGKRDYHTAEIRTIEEARLVYAAAKRIKSQILDGDDIQSTISAH